MSRYPGGLLESALDIMRGLRMRVVGLVIVLAVSLVGPVVSSKTIELSFWHQFGKPNLLAKLTELVGRYETMHPDVKIKLMTSTSGDQVLVALAGGVGPDIFWQTGSLLYPALPYVVPLDKYIDKEPGFREDHFPGLWIEAMLDGKTYGIPFEHASIGLGFNKAMFIENGLNIKGPQNWSEFRSAARKLTDPQHNKDGVYLALENLSWATSVIYGSLLTTNGGRFMDINERVPLITTPQAVEAFEYLHELVQVSRVASPRTSKISAGTTGMTLQLSGEIARDFVSPSQMMELVGSAMMPANVSRGSINTSKNMYVTKSTSEREDAAWQFLSWLVSPQINFEWQVQTMGYLPTRRSVVRMPDFQQWLKENPFMYPWLEQAEHIVSRPRGPGWTILNNHLKTAVEQSIIKGTIPPRTALEDADRKSKSEIAQLK